MARSSTIAIFVFAMVVTAAAQTPISQNVDRAQLLRNQPPTLRDQGAGTESGESVAPASPNDPDLGEQAILKRSDEYKPWSISVSAPVSYTSNVALTSRNEKSDEIFTPSLAVAFAPRLTPTLYGNFVLSQQMFYYRRFGELNFGSFDARAGLTYSVPRAHNLIFRADYAYNRLTTDSFDEFFSSHSLNFGAEIPFRIGRAQQLSIGTDASFNLTSDPAPPGRNEYSVYAAYSAAVARNLTINGVFRLAVRDYTEVDRVDVSEIFALSATYRVTAWMAVNLVVSYAHNDSNRDIFDYDVVNAGVAASVTFRF